MTCVISFICIIVIHCLYTVIAINSFKSRNQDILLQHLKLIYQQSFSLQKQVMQSQYGFKRMEFVWTIRLNTSLQVCIIMSLSTGKYINMVCRTQNLETAVMLNLLQLSGFNRNRTEKTALNLFHWCWFHLVQWGTFPHRWRPFIQLQLEHNYVMQVNRKMPKIWQALAFITLTLNIQWESKSVADDFPFFFCELQYK